MATHSSTFAQKIPWTEEPTTSLSLSLSCIGEGNGNPLQCFLPGEFQGGGSLVGCRLWDRTESDTTEETQQQTQQKYRHGSCEMYDLVNKKVIKQTDTNKYTCNCSYKGLPRWLSGKEPVCQCRKHEFNFWVGKIPRRRKQQTHSSILT